VRIRLCSRYDPVTRQTRVCRCASALTLVTVHRSSPLCFCIRLLLAAFRPPSSYRPIVNGCLVPSRRRAQELIVMSCPWESVAPSRRHLVVLCRRISVLITSSGHIWAWNQSRNCHCHAFLFGLSITIYVCRLDCGYLLFYLVTCLIFDYLVFRTVFKILSQIGSLVPGLFLSSFLRFCPRLVLLFLSSVPSSVNSQSSVLGSVLVILKMLRHQRFILKEGGV